MWFVTSFYKFHKFTDLEALVKELEGKLSEFEGLFLVAHEGMNATVATKNQSLIIPLKKYLENLVGTIEWKDSTSHKRPFKRLTIQIRDEIVTLKRPDLVPETSQNNHLSPSEWHKVLKDESESIVLIDTRNDYETKIGKFKGALDPNIHHFSQFKDFLESSNIDKDKKVLMYCTGGVRCEKAILEMQQRGYENVYQLEGGILKYLEEYPDGFFEGECFVFDHRVSVDSNLKESSRYTLCPLCGNPGERKINCSNCGKFAIVCENCLVDACSKNCRYHLGGKNGRQLKENHA